MLYKNYDNMLVGRNFLSLIYSFELLRKGKRTLLLDDERIQFGKLYSRQLGQVEVEYLKLWGREHSLSPLMNVENYLINRQPQFVLNGVHLLLGDSPAYNLRELLRKFPSFFSSGDERHSSGFFDDFKDSSHIDSFNTSYESLCRQLAKASYQQQSFVEYSSPEFLGHYSKELYSSYKEFMKSWEDNRESGMVEGANWRTFLLAIRSFFHKKFQLHIGPQDLLHLFISLLGPVYELDENRLTDDLLKIFRQRGGSFKRTRIREWLFDNQKPWSLELASFEGIIHPKSIVLFGGIPKKMPVSLKSPIEMYVGVNLQIRFGPHADRLKSFSTSRQLIWSVDKKIGASGPIWLVDFTDRGVSMTTFLKREKGMKIDFYQRELKEQAQEMMDQYFQMPCSLEFDDVRFNEEVWSGVDELGDEKIFGAPVGLYDVSAPLVEKPLKDVDYFGPSKGGKLGLFSTLMELRLGLDFV